MAYLMSLSAGRVIVLFLSNVRDASEHVMALSGIPLARLAGITIASLLILGGLWFARMYRESRTHGAHSSTTTQGLTAYDSVTGLPTGRLFGSLLGQALSHAEKTGRSVALLIVELDHFRMVSERQGQASGNMLARVQAARVKSVLRSSDTVARLAQDQFAMIVDNLSSPEEITAVVQRTQATVELPLTLDGHELFLTCRIGGAFYPHDAADREQLIDQAVQAVKTAKTEGQAVRFASICPLPVSATALIAQGKQEAQPIGPQTSRP